MKQTTLKEGFSLKGKGLHSGLDITAEFLPAPDNHGYKFQRVDVEGEPIIDALAENVKATTRGTVIGRGDVHISTIEHSLAALYAAGVDNCLIKVNGPEMPILDGSASDYANEILRVGTVEQDSEKDYYVVKQKIEVRDDTTGSSIVVLPDDEFSIDTMVAFDSPVLPNQFASLDNLSDFAAETEPHFCVRSRDRTSGQKQPHQGRRSGKRHCHLRLSHGTDRTRPHSRSGQFAP